MEIALDSLSHLPSAAPISTDANSELVDEGLGASRRLGVRQPLKALDQIRSPIEGTILFAGQLAPRLNMIVIEPERDIQVFIQSASEPVISTGDIVDQGQLIALFGPILTADNSLSSNRDPDQLGLAADEIYIEVRISGEPTEPFQWFQLEQEE